MDEEFERGAAHVRRFGVARPYAEILAELDRALLAHVVGEQGVDVLELETGLAERFPGSQRHHREFALIDDLAQRRFGRAGDIDRRLARGLGHPRSSEKRGAGRAAKRHGWVSR